MTKIYFEFNQFSDFKKSDNLSFKLLKLNSDIEFIFKAEKTELLQFFKNCFNLCESVYIDNERLIKINEIEGLLSEKNKVKCYYQTFASDNSMNLKINDISLFFEYLTIPFYLIL